ncbi:GM14257 [Drosophila sechellia]|uniref:GM14257 n=1 Tax=Drosophila sechellia TaxID=7238 RepID=B4HVJ2_DROSE|nr:GM14257 [Drosophila sechellia]
MYSDNAHENSNGSHRIRNVLTLEERVAAIRQYDIVPMYSKIARNFNCSWEQIKSIVSNREAILEFHKATNRLSQPANKEAELRRRKLNFLGHCLYEYIQRAQFYLHSDVNEEMIRNRAIEFRTSCESKITIVRRPPRSMDLRDIMSYCGRHTSMSCSLAPRSPEPTLTSSDRPLYRTKTLVTTSCQNQATSDEVHLRRKRKLAFLEKCVYEYIQRSQLVRQGRLDLDNLRFVAISLRDILKIDSFFPDKVWLKHFKSRYNFNFTVGVQVTNRRLPLSLDLRDIVSYCGRNEHKITLDPKKSQEELSQSNKTDLDQFPQVEPKPEESEHEEDDDCVAIEVPPELIEIKDDEDEHNEDLPERATKRKSEENSGPMPCGLKIQKIQSLNEALPEENAELLPANSPGHYSETSDEANLPRCVESYKDALRLLKPLEEFVLMEENYRAIGLLTQLEKIFESAAKKSEEMDKSLE